jgi:hypothetical protein
MTNASESKSMILVRNKNVEQGITTFGLWVNAEEKRSLYYQL